MPPLGTVLPDQQALEGHLVATAALPIDQAASGPIERRPDPQLVRLGAEIVPHLVHLDDDGALGDRFETACLDIVGHPPDHRVGASNRPTHRNDNPCP